MHLFRNSEACNAEFLYEYLMEKIDSQHLLDEKKGTRTVYPLLLLIFGCLNLCRQQVLFGIVQGNQNRWCDLELYNVCAIQYQYRHNTTKMSAPIKL